MVYRYKGFRLYENAEVLCDTCPGTDIDVMVLSHGMWRRADHECQQLTMYV